MKWKPIFYIIIFGSLFTFAYSAERAAVVHNTLDEINACKETLTLRLVRVWGGDEEEDVNKFFKAISSIAFDSRGMIYICDIFSHCFKVFKPDGQFVHAVGQKGRGPGDLYGPCSIAVAPNGDLVVLESGGFRIQRFGSDGKSKQIIKLDDSLGWIAVTSKDEWMLYSPRKTFLSRKLVFVLDNEGKTIREIGQYHDRAKSFMNSERLIFTIDTNDDIYAANRHTPVIRRYSPGGRLIMAVTFEPPFEIPPVHMALNERGDELKIVNEGEETEETRIRGGIVQTVRKKGKQWKKLINGIATDSEKRLYVVTPRRLLSESEKGKYSSRTHGNLNGTVTEGPAERPPEHIDLYQLLVFDSRGKIFTRTSLTTFAGNIYISGNRLFIVDTSMERRILEYAMIYKE
jgi:hypothetical protein